MANTNEGDSRRFNLLAHVTIMATSTDDVYRQLARYFGKIAYALDNNQPTGGIEPIFLDGGVISVSDVADFETADKQTNYYGVDESEIPNS